MAVPADAMATKQFHKLLSQAKRIVVLTGAGVSAESGIPTFRGEGGLWRKYVSEGLSQLKGVSQARLCH
jgi:NAD-dependent deacetylase sirtuin 5